jgi:hypothetical protein
VLSVTQFQARHPAGRHAILREPRVPVSAGVGIDAVGCTPTVPPDVISDHAGRSETFWGAINAITAHG